MKLLIVRHGPAGDRHEWEAKGRDDRLRPLTSKGRKEMQLAAAGLARLVPALDVLATSPWVRAAQSAEIVAAEYGSDVVSLEALTPEHKPEDVVRWLDAQTSVKTVAVVGHEPHLSTLAGYLLTMRSASFIDLEKGGACLLQLSGPPEPGTGTLEWLLTLDALACLGE